MYVQIHSVVYHSLLTRIPQAISERIKELDIDDCKVRVTNVDSQGSFEKSIVIQVIGEMSMKGAPHKKFVQTFVLAKQHNGYYVLNDIFRYIAEEEEEELEEAPAPEPEASLAPEPETQLGTLPSSDNLAEQERGAEKVDSLLEKKAGSEPAALSAVANGTSEAPESTTEESTTEPETVEEPENAVESVEAEVPQDPVPTPAQSSPKPQKAAPAAPKELAAPPKPAAPKTWASMLAGNAAAAAKAAAAPVPATPSVTQSQSKKNNNAAVSQVASAQTTGDDSQPLPSPGGWQTAGQDHSKKQNRQQSNSVSGAAPEKTTVLGYIKNVTEKVDAAVLKSTLSKYGKLDYFDVSRQKVCFTHSTTFLPR